MEVALLARLQSTVVDCRRRDSPRVSRNNGYEVNNTSISVGGNNSWKNECQACGFSHQLADSRNVTPSKRQFLLDRLERPSRFATATIALLRSAMEAEKLLSKSTTLPAGIEVEVVGLHVIVATIVLFPAFATLANNRATLEGTAPTIYLKYIKQT